MKTKFKDDEYMAILLDIREGSRNTDFLIMFIGYGSIGAICLDAKENGYITLNNDKFEITYKGKIHLDALLYKIFVMCYYNISHLSYACCKKYNLPYEISRYNLIEFSKRIAQKYIKIKEKIINKLEKEYSKFIWDFGKDDFGLFQLLYKPKTNSKLKYKDVVSTKFFLEIDNFVESIIDKNDIDEKYLFDELIIQYDILNESEKIKMENEYTYVRIK